MSLARRLPDATPSMPTPNPFTLNIFAQSAVEDEPSGERAQ